MKVVLGIGNPGREYADTRHNVGFRVVERVAALLAVPLGAGRPVKSGRGEGWTRKRKLKCLTADARAAPGPDDPSGERVLLVKPETYVNLSGECARAVLDYYGVGVDSLLVVSDDVNLALGRLRCRRGGSSGGHNGMESVIRHLGAAEFARLRVGVGRPARRSPCEGTDARPATPGRQRCGPDARPPSRTEDKDGEGPLVSHVLGRFAADERPAAERAESLAAEAVLEWVRNGVESCMNAYNSSRGGGTEGEA